MKKAWTAKKWLISFLGIFLSVILILCLVAFAVDPFYQFRYEQNHYFNNTAKFPGPGLVKNYDYDTLILGSSMTQNFDMDLFREELGARPLHIGIGGMGIDELLAYIRLSEQVGKCENYYICIDQYMLTDAESFKTPEYLFRDDAVSALRYLLSYEVWFRYLPLDAALTAANGLQLPLPAKFAQSSDIDLLANWENDYAFGEDAVIRNYLRDEYGVSKVETEGLYERMTAWTDKLFDSLPGEKERYHFFFPPYSVLFWCDAKHDGYFEIYQEAKRYFLEKARSCGIEVFDFQSAECVYDLNNYKDITHYRGEINDWMVSSFADGSYRLNEDVIDPNIAKLRDEVDAFISENQELFEGTAGSVK